MAIPPLNPSLSSQFPSSSSLPEETSRERELDTLQENRHTLETSGPLPNPKQKEDIQALETEMSQVKLEIRGFSNAIHKLCYRINYTEDRLQILNAARQEFFKADKQAQKLEKEAVELRQQSKSVEELSAQADLCRQAASKALTSISYFSSIDSLIKAIAIKEGKRAQDTVEYNLLAEKRELAKTQLKSMKKQLSKLTSPLKLLQRSKTRPPISVIPSPITTSSVTSSPQMAYSRTVPHLFHPHLPSSSVFPSSPSQRISQLFSALEQQAKSQLLIQQFLEQSAIERIAQNLSSIIPSPFHTFPSTSISHGTPFSTPFSRPDSVTESDLHSLDPSIRVRPRSATPLLLPFTSFPPPPSTQVPPTTPVFTPLDGPDMLSESDPHSLDPSIRVRPRSATPLLLPFTSFPPPPSTQVPPTTPFSTPDEEDDILIGSNPHSLEPSKQVEDIFSSLDNILPQTDVFSIKKEINEQSQPKKRKMHQKDVQGRKTFKKK